MAKRSLIMYASLTGNTEKVAYRFKKAFEKKEWLVDLWKIDKNTDIQNPEFNIRSYDFLCAGSPIIHKMPIEKLITLLSGGRPLPSLGGFNAFGGSVATPGPLPSGGHPPPVGHEAKIVFGPDTMKGIAFCTYGGIHLGPKESEPAVALISLIMEHIPCQVVGRFACPGRYDDNTGWYKDLKERPNERDLQKAETFMEEILEDL